MFGRTIWSAWSARLIPWMLNATKTSKQAFSIVRLYYRQTSKRASSLHLATGVFFVWSHPLPLAGRDPLCTSQSPLVAVSEITHTSCVQRADESSNHNGKQPGKIKKVSPQLVCDHNYSRTSSTQTTVQTQLSRSFDRTLGAGIGDTTHLGLCELYKHSNFMHCNAL